MPFAEAKIRAWPGTLAVTISWFNGAPVGGALTVTFELRACHENGPALDVMSAVPLNANASYSHFSGPAGAPFDRQLTERVGGWVAALLRLTLVMCWCT